MDVSSNGDGIVKVDQIGIPSYPFTYNIESDSAVSIEAVPSFGYVFSGWGGDLTGTTNPAILTMDCDKNITANFALNWPVLGSITGTIVVAGFLGAILVIRRKD